jgi:hypothetical protein
VCPGLILKFDHSSKPKQRYPVPLKHNVWVLNSVLSVDSVSLLQTACCYKPIKDPYRSCSLRCASDEVYIDRFMQSDKCIWLKSKLTSFFMNTTHALNSNTMPTWWMSRQSAISFALWQLKCVEALYLTATVRRQRTERGVASTVHRPGDDPRKDCEECGNARGSNVRYYPTWKHSRLKDYWLTNAHELLTTEWLKY